MIWEMSCQVAATDNNRIRMASSVVALFLVLASALTLASAASAATVIGPVEIEKKCNLLFSYNAGETNSRKVGSAFSVTCKKPQKRAIYARMYAINRYDRGEESPEVRAVGSTTYVKGSGVFNCSPGVDRSQYGLMRISVEVRLGSKTKVFHSPKIGCS